MHHISYLAVGLAVAASCFVACAIGMTTNFQTIALFSGMALFFLFTCALFYATLHLQKVR